MKSESTNRPRDLAAETIENHIIDEGLKPGDRLPSERDMLLLTTLKSETYPYLFIGFILETILANIVTADGNAVFATVMPVAIIGTCLAAINYMYEKRIDQAIALAGSGSNGGDSDGI